MYKKIYIEVTNNCNLKCDFCIKNTRKIEYLEIEKFKKILNKINGYTDYLYFHILGEPLMHPEINELINIASQKFKINITTNGYLIDRIKNNKNIRQLNISLHSYNEKYGVSLDEYLNKIFETVDELKKYTYISFRCWVKNKYNDEILKKINKKYGTNLTFETIKNNTTISNNIFISKINEFVWPDLNNERKNKCGKCYALKDHIGILVDGTIVPCCLDTKGIIKLGNIYDNELNEIIESNRYKNMLLGFKKNQRIEELCQKCNFL